MKPKLHLISNSKSGKGKGDNISQLAQEICSKHGFELIDYKIENPKEIVSKAQAAIKAAKQSENDVVAAAGGDGTIRTVAEEIQNTGVKFAVIPCGTFNYFARTHAISEEHGEAIELAVTGVATPVRLGEMNGRVFLINASMGIYAQSMIERESTSKKFGRSRIVMMLTTLKTLLGPHRLLTVRMKTKDEASFVRTPMIFIGNNALQLRNLSLHVAKCFEKDLLAVVTLKPVRGWEMIRILLRGVTKTLQQDERLDQICTETLTIETKRKSMKVALDGEIFDMSSPYEIRALPGAVLMVKPPISENN